MDPRFTNTDGDRSPEATIEANDEASLTADLGAHIQGDAVEVVA